MEEHLAFFPDSMEEQALLFRCLWRSMEEHLECGMQPLSRDARLRCPIANEWYGIAGLRVRRSYYGSSHGKRQGRVPVGGIGLRGP